MLRILNYTLRINQIQYIIIHRGIHCLFLYHNKHYSFLCSHLCYIIIVIFMLHHPKYTFDSTSYNNIMVSLLLGEGEWARI